MMTTSLADERGEIGKNVGRNAQIAQPARDYRPGDAAAVREKRSGLAAPKIASARIAHVIERRGEEELVERRPT